MTRLFRSRWIVTVGGTTGGIGEPVGGSPGVPVKCARLSTAHGTDIPIPQATFVFPGPRHASLVYNASIQVVGTMGGSSGPMFTGVIRDDEDAIIETGSETTVHAQHPAYILGLKNPVAANWGVGGIFADTLIEHIAQLAGFGARGQPSMTVDRIRDAAGGRILLAPDLAVDPDGVVMDEDQTYLSIIEEATDPWGYRGYGLPDGRWRVMRIVADPPAVVVAAFAQGVDAFSMGRVRTSEMMANWHIVEGKRYRTAAGEDRVIRSVPTTAPTSALYPARPAARSLRRNLIGSQALADKARTIREIQYNRQTPEESYKIRTYGRPKVFPGYAATGTSTRVGASGNYWVREVSHDADESGIIANVELWRPGGSALTTGLPAGDPECTTVALAPALTVYHVGDNTVTGFAKPIPDGTTVTVAYTPAATVQSLTITGRAHSTNFSGLFDAGTSPTGVNRIEIWQGTTKVGTAPLPVIGTLSQDVSPPNYTNDALWEDFSAVVSGPLTGGVAAEVRFIAGHYTLSNGGAYVDEYEVKAIGVTSCVAGVPAAPTVPVRAPRPAPSATPACANSVTSGTATEAGTVRVEAGGWTVPIGTKTVTARGVFTGLNATNQAGTGLVGQAFRWFSNGGTTTINTPGTITRKTTDGDGEHVWTFTIPLTVPYVVTVSDFTLQAFNGSFSVTDLCVTFSTT